MSETLLISEIYKSIQGESTFVGLPCIFVRLTGCDLRCNFCDSVYSFSGGKKMALDEIVKEVLVLDCPLIEITGGEPLLQKNILPLMKILCDEGKTVLIETSGAHDISNIAGNVNLRITNGSEKFWPLGSKTEKGIASGEYAYIDDNNDVLCRMEVRQVEKTKVTLQTTQNFYIVQGNLETEPEYIINAAEKLINLTKNYCGGDIRFLYTP